MRPVDKPRLKGAAGRAGSTRSRKFIILLLCGLSVSLGGACRKSATSRDERKASKPAKHSPATERSPVAGSEKYNAPVRLANLEDRRVDESSGIVASRANPGVYWTHNDSGDAPQIYAFDREGKSRGAWRVTGASASDWEDIAAGPGDVRGTPYLYIGDIGDNKRDGNVVTVYRVAEPTVETVAGSNSGVRSFQTAPAEVIRLKFPDGKHDAEALLIHPQTGDLYLITKTKREAAKVYKATAPFDTSTIIPLAFVSDLQLPGLVGGLVTGADISPDGQRIVICDYLGAYELALPRADSDFDSIWQQPPSPVALGYRQQGEAVCYRLDGKAILATSEETPTPLIEALRKE
jgi:hypothetical protein